MDLNELYQEKEIKETSKKKVLNTISSVQLFARVLDLYMVKSIETAAKFIQVITNDNKE